MAENLFNADYEVVDSQAVEEQTSTELTVISETKELGSVVTNFKDLVPLVRQKCAKYKDIVATEDNLKDIYDLRASLRKTQTALKAEWKKAKEEFAKPLADHESAYKELLGVFDDAIYSLSTEYDKVDKKLKDARYNQRALAVREAVEKALTEDELYFYKHCSPSWIFDPRWENVKYTAKDLKAFADNLITGIKTAWSTLEGKWRDQMIEVYAQTGDLAQALAEGKRLQAQADYFAEAEKARLEREKAEREARMGEGFKKSEPVVRPVTEEISQTSAPTVEISSIEDIRNVYTTPISDGNSENIVAGTFRFRGPRYKIQWLLDVAKKEGLEVQQIKKKEA